MSKVTRYTHCPVYGMVSVPQGKLVTFDDYQSLRDELKAVKAEQLSGYIENMRLLENEANLQDKAGLRMMCSFAVKTATEYANQVEKG